MMYLRSSVVSEAVCAPGIFVFGTLIPLATVVKWIFSLIFILLTISAQAEVSCLHVFNNFTDQNIRVKSSTLFVATNWKSHFEIPTTVIYLGESHPNPHIRPEVYKNLYLARKMGVTHLVLEALPSNYQALVNRYMISGDEGLLRNIQEVLKNEWGWDPLSYANLIKEAKRIGISVVALDMPHVLQETIAEEQVLNARDIFMSERIRSVANENPSNKLLVLIGADHSRKSRQPLMLARFGITSTSFLFVDNNSETYRQAQQSVGTIKSSLSIFGNVNSADHDGSIVLPMGNYVEGNFPNFFNDANKIRLKTNDQ